MYQRSFFFKVKSHKCFIFSVLFLLLSLYVLRGVGFELKILVSAKIKKIPKVFNGTFKEAEIKNLPRLSLYSSCSEWSGRVSPRRKHGLHFVGQIGDLDNHFLFESPRLRKRYLFLEIRYL